MGDAKGEEENMVPALDSPSHSVGGNTHASAGETTTATASSKKGKGKRHGRKKSSVEDTGPKLEGRYTGDFEDGIRQGHGE